MYAQSQKVVNPNNLNVIRKSPKQDSHDEFEDIKGRLLIIFTIKF
jgi:hypothetical protein